MRLKLKKPPGKFTKTARRSGKGQLQLFLRVVGYLDLGRANFFDLNGCRPVNVAVIAIKSHRALHMEFVFDAALVQPAHGQMTPAAVWFDEKADFHK